ncbi:unnamed protein product [Symbiodinium sp. CCMP2456]|nr:unnamed protein product [Symbiodinium sp. CCMP2456]
MSYNGFIKLHDHMKIFGGYFRFTAILGLGAARAVFYGLQPVDSVQEPFFNSSATYALLAMMILEVVEDAVVLWELLPMAPVPREVLNLHHGHGRSMAVRGDIPLWEQDQVGFPLDQCGSLRTCGAHRNTCDFDWSQRFEELLEPVNPFRWVLRRTLTTAGCAESADSFDL